MKILFLMPHLNSGGAERTLSYVSSHMVEAGHDVVVVTLTNNIFYALNPKIELESLGISTVSANRLQKYVNIYKRFKRVEESIKKHKPDVVFCMLPTMAKYVLQIKNRYDFVLITSERNNPLFDTDEEKRIKAKIYNKSNGIIFQTQRARECFPENIQKKGIVIPNAIGNEQAYQVTSSKEKKNKFFAVGRLSKQKDYPTMFRAFAEFLKKHPGYILDIYGDGALKKQLSDLAKELGILENINFKGVSKDALKESADAKCFILSSVYEGMPNVLMEAMAIGIPCISTDCPFGPGELIDNGENGILVPVGDMEALKEAMCKMVEDEEFAQYCGNNARKLLDTNSISAISERYLNYVVYISEKGEVK